MVSTNMLSSKLDKDELDLSMMRLTDIPVNDIAALPKATKIDLANNELTSIPQNFAHKLSHIVKLELGSNKIRELPTNFGTLSKLRHLDLYNNQLTDLPSSLQNLKNLKYLDVKGNNFKPELAKALGTCINSRECQNAAKNLIVYMSKQLEKQNNIKAQKDKEREIARQKKEEKEQAKQKAEKQVKKEKKKQEWKTNKTESGTNNNSGKQQQNGASSEAEKSEKKKDDDKKNERDSKQKWYKKTASGWFSFSFKKVFLLLIASLAVGTCLILHSEGDFSVNGLRTKALPKIQKNSMLFLNRTRESFTRENIEATMKRSWKTLQPVLLKLKDGSLVLLDSSKRGAINFYETLKTGDVNIYKEGLKNFGNSCLEFGSWSVSKTQEGLDKINWTAIIETLKWGGETALEMIYRGGKNTLEFILTTKEAIVNNETLIMYWKNTEGFRYSCLNYTLIAKDRVVKVSNDLYVDYYPVVKEKTVLVYDYLYEYITKLSS